MLHLIIIALTTIISCFEKTSYVNTLFGTAGYIYDIGALPTGVLYPFGQVRLSPDTVNKYNAYIPQLHAGGYYYTDKYIRIFSHVHMEGAGLPDYGNIGVMPYMIKKGRAVEYRRDIQDYNYKKEYRVNKARPGEFDVDLIGSETQGINVRLSASKYCGFHRYEYGNDTEMENYVMFYVAHGLCTDAVEDSFIDVNETEQLIRGWVLYKGALTSRIGGVFIHFAARTNVNWKEYGVWGDKKVFEQSSNYRGKDVGGYISGFENEGPIELSVGISFVSQPQALINLDKDGAGRSFDQAMKDAKNAWEKELSVIEVTGGSEEQKRTFYSLMYRSFSAPTLFSEVGGIYTGFDHSSHTIPSDSNGYYSDMSIWDVHRTQFPLLTLLKPDLMKDIIRSLVLMYQQGGYFPKWPIANGYTECMIGQHAMCIISDVLQKGIDDFDVKTAYSGLKDAATLPQERAGRHVKEWIKYGFYPDDKEIGIGKSACHTLASSFDDGCLALMAKKLGHEDDYSLFHNRSMGYKKVFDDETKFFCPKSTSGVFDCPKDFTDIFDKRYVEGDAWHWRFFVPHDAEGLVDLFGKDRFIKELETFMSKEFECILEILPNKYFWVGNEHNLLSPWLFNYAGRSDLTQKYTRKVLSYFYNSTEWGLPGNDDFGTTSSWGLWAMMGFYPITGIPKYSIGSPVFETMKIHLPTHDLLFTMHNYGEQNIYIDKIEINGKSHDGLFFDHNKDFFNNNTNEDVKIDIYMKK